MSLAFFNLFCVLNSAAVVAGQSFLSFESASASSLLSADGFAAKSAIAQGSGYWCSTGGHSSKHIVTWTGSVGARVPLVGIQITWAYAPGETKVLVSEDGGNFVEAAGWTVSGQEQTHTQTFMFGKRVKAKYVTISMRSPMPWGFFGMSFVQLLTKPFPFMLVLASSGVSPSRDLCVVESGTDVALQSCIEAVASLDGREIWTLSNTGVMLSSSQRQLSLLHGDVVAGGTVVLGSWRDGGDSNGAQEWIFTEAGQLELRHMSGFCLDVAGGHLGVGRCNDDSFALASTFRQVPVLEATPSSGSVARGVAEVLAFAVQRQRRLLAQLQAMAKNCKLPVSMLQKGVTNETAVEAFLTRGSAAEPYLEAIELILPSLGVDVHGLQRLLDESRTVLTAIQTRSVA